MKILYTILLTIISIISNGQDSRFRPSLNPHDINSGVFVVDSAVIRIFTDSNYYENSLSLTNNSYISIIDGKYNYEVSTKSLLIIKNYETLNIAMNYTPEGIYYICVDNGDILFINNDIIKIDNIINGSRAIMYYYIRGGSIKTIQYKEWIINGLGEN